MTKEELKQKAYEYAIKEIPFIECITQNDLEILVQQAYITGAESREKRIEELKKSLSGIVYMVTNGLHVKNQIAFDRCIAEAEKLLKRVDK